MERRSVCDGSRKGVRWRWCGTAASSGAVRAVGDGRGEGGKGGEAEKTNPAGGGGVCRVSVG
jgi:hypothetical protein